MEIDHYRAVVKDIDKVVEYYKDSELQTLFMQLSELQSHHEGFDSAFNEVKSEIESRKEEFQVDVL